MSSYFGRAAKTDTNQAQIVKELRFMGFDVDPVHRLKRLYDLVVTGTPRWADRAVAVRVEVKSGKGQLSEDEADYWQKQRHIDNLIVARETEDVLRWFGMCD